MLGDIDLAEEAVQEAFTTAAERWPRTGTPPSPAGWIITTARNRAIDRLRREAQRDSREAQAALLAIPDDVREEGPVRTTGCGSSSPAATPRWPSRPRWRSPCGCSAG